MLFLFVDHVNDRLQTSEVNGVASFKWCVQMMVILLIEWDFGPGDAKHQGVKSHGTDIFLLWPLLLTWINFNPGMDK